MKKDFLTTDSYKGVRDFYPEDMAIQQYIFDIWTKTAKSFGFEQYDASILEPSALYKAKGAENEEMVNEQTYTFIDRGDREVTLRPEMTPTVARMVAKKHRELAFPLRWYSIPNLFRYERPQRGRLREHWQLNCDIFGSDDYTADVEVIALAYQTFIDFGATPDMFEILINNRATMNLAYETIGIDSEVTITEITRLNDRKDKISSEDYITQLTSIIGNPELAEEVIVMLEAQDGGDNEVVAGLKELGINNVRLDRSLARGFDYYTGTIFEFKDTSPDNNRSLLGGGRYDNLTEMFGGEAISGIGFGLGDITMRDFLGTHKLLPDTSLNRVNTIVVSTEKAGNLHAQKVAQKLRKENISVSVDFSNRSLVKTLHKAETNGAEKVIVIGEPEYKAGTYIMTDIKTKEETTHSL